MGSKKAKGKAAGPKAAGSKAAGPTKKKKPTIKSAAGLPLESIEIKSDDWDELFLSDGEWDRRTQRGRGAKGKNVAAGKAGARSNSASAGKYLVADYSSFSYSYYSDYVPPPRKSYKPYFTTIAVVIHVVVFAAMAYIGQPFEAFPDPNPFWGPPADIIIDFQARWFPIMQDNNEYWRLATAVFVHGGVVQLLICAMIGYAVSMDVERELGPVRTGVLYLLSGISGHLMSTVFLPQEVSCGSSGAIYGLLGAQLVQIIEHWADKKVRGKKCRLITLVVSVVVFLFLGFVPYIDNFAHIGGFVCGVLLSFALWPTTVYSRWDKRCKSVAIMISVPLFCVLFGGGAVVMFWELEQFTGWCPFCEKINCLFFCDGLLETLPLSELGLVSGSGSIDLADLVMGG